ncbi:unnamed protein product [Soboliphyme baturini]|uniref:MYND-type domain-containing protein n=1 Tax=Soboliphyme baturini TaxID=241478 RepID=A0A183IEG1_9BILA|nr:unnamed protein product [Soboliphyme baturini]
MNREAPFLKQMINPCDINLARSRLSAALQLVRVDHANASAATSDTKDAYEGTDDTNKDAKFPRCVSSLSRMCKKRGRTTHKKVIFELRQKSFEIQNVYEQLTLYSLCRTWLLGKSETSFKQDKCIQTVIKSEFDGTTEPAAQIETVATSQNVYHMPAASDQNDEVCEEAPRIQSDALSPPTAQSILLEYLPHWRNVRKYWQNKCRMRSKRYEKSLSLLRTMFAFEWKTVSFRKLLYDQYVEKEAKRVIAYVRYLLVCCAKNTPQPGNQGGQRHKKFLKLLSLTGLEEVAIVISLLHLHAPHTSETRFTWCVADISLRSSLSLLPSLISVFLIVVAFFTAVADSSSVEYCPRSDAEENRAAAAADDDMADTFSKNLRKKTFRAKEKLLESFGKADRTIDETFEENAQNFYKQQAILGQRYRPRMPDCLDCLIVVPMSQLCKMCSCVSRLEERIFAINPFLFCLMTKLGRYRTKKRITNKQHVWFVFEWLQEFFCASRDERVLKCFSRYLPESEE